MEIYRFLFCDLTFYWHICLIVINVQLVTHMYAHRHRIKAHGEECFWGHPEAAEGSYDQKMPISL